MLTAPRSYAARLSQALIAEGALPILMPAIATCHLENFTALYVALEHLDQYDWIAFTSRNGIEAFFERTLVPLLGLPKRSPNFSWIKLKKSSVGVKLSCDRCLP
ncbi:MAG TPA: uroporphyrinogen-III synthase [Allocoleopsis sp.]